MPEGKRPFLFFTSCMALCPELTSVFSPDKWVIHSCLPYQLVFKVLTQFHSGEYSLEHETMLDRGEEM